MTVRRIIFRGNAIACAKYLPWAKGKLKTLAVTNQHRHSWTHEYQVGSDSISLEQNGPIQWIRIKAGLVGYEYATVTDPLLDSTSEGGYNAYFTIAAHRERDELDPVNPELPLKEPYLKAVNRRGTGLKPENANKDNDIRDKWIRASRYDPLDDEEDENSLYHFFYPTHDWFQVPHPGNDNEATLLIDGTPRTRMMHWNTWRQKGIDTSLWHDGFGLIIPVIGEVFHTSASARTRLTGLSLAVSAEWVENHFPRCGGACVQGGVFLAASWNGYDFLFEARNENYEEYITGSTFFYITKPTWISAGEIDVMTHWYWRGDGKRAVSLQYASTRRPDDRDEWTLENFDPDIDAGFVEIEAITNQPTGDIAPVLPDIEFKANQHNLQNMGIHPLAIDYRMLDSRKKLAYYFKVYIGPIRISDTPSSGYYTVEYARDLLIYLVCAEIDTTFPGTELWRIPVWHSTGWRGVNIADPEPPNDPLLQRTLLDGIYWYTDIGYPILSEQMTDAAGASIHPYREIRAVVQANDCRAEALAVNYRVTMVEPHTVEGYGSEDTVYHYGKVWRIWGEERQNTWIHPDTTTGIDEPGAGYRPTYSWFDTDPTVWEDADPPEPDPTLPPADFFNYLDDLPADYEVFTRGHAYDFKGVWTGIYNIMATINASMPFLGRGPGQFSPYRAYQGFRIAPTKSFALYIGTAANYEFVNGAAIEEDYTYGVPPEWWVWDFIEKNLGRDPETGEVIVLTEKHGELYNSSRDTEWDWCTREDSLNVACTNGLWVE